MLLTAFAVIFWNAQTVPEVDFNIYNNLLGSPIAPTHLMDTSDVSITIR